MQSMWFRHFKISKRPGFKMPPCRHRVITAPSMPKLGASESKITVEAAPSFEKTSSAQSYKTESTQQKEQEEPEDDTHAWLAQRLKIKRDVETFVNLEKWTCRKPKTTILESRVLKNIYRDRENALAAKRAAELASAKKIKPVGHRRSIPSIIMPKPSCLSVLYEYLLSHKIKVIDLFTKGEWEHHITREELIQGMKRIGVPLSPREFEEVVIYLSSLNKQNVINWEDLVASYKSWVIAKRIEMQEKRKNRNFWKSRFRRHFGKGKKRSFTPPPSTLSFPLLKVPSINTEPDRMHLSYEDMEEAGKRYRELRRQNAKKINPLLFMEKCRLVRTGNKMYDDHCLPSTLPNELGEMIDNFRRATFLTYLKCVKACEVYGIPLTEKILMKALLYPGDKLIMEKGNVLKIRQPGGYYDEVKEFIPTKAKYYTIYESAAKKKSQKPSKKMTFGEFESLARKLKHRSSSLRGARSNIFWPGHLLDKLLLYLPDKKWEKQLALFSRVDRLPHAYPAKYNPDSFWPISDTGYVTYGNFYKEKSL